MKPFANWQRDACGGQACGALWVFLALSLLGHAVLGFALTYRHWPRPPDEAGLKVVLVTARLPLEPAPWVRPPEADRPLKVRSPAPESRVDLALRTAGPRSAPPPGMPATAPEPRPREVPAGREPPAAARVSPGGAGQTPAEGLPPSASPDDGVGLSGPSPDAGRVPRVAEGPPTGVPVSGTLSGASGAAGRPLLRRGGASPGSEGGDGTEGGTASGPGGAGTGGAGRRAADSTPGSAVASDAWALLGLIRQRIERAKVYPPAAREAGIQGQVLLRFRLRPDGSVLSVEMVRSSGSTILDRASEQTVTRGAPYPYFPGWIHLPLSFRLDER